MVTKGDTWGGGINKQLTYTHYYIENRSGIRTYDIAQENLLNTL